jgi:hypothetical protein
MIKNKVRKLIEIISYILNYPYGINRRGKDGK